MAVIVFDLDGTLVDSAPDIHEAVNRMLADEGAAPMELGEVRGFIGNGVPVLIERVMEARGEASGAARRDALRQRFMAHYDAAPVALTTLYPGVAEALAALTHEGHRLALCTNKPAGTARAVLAAFDIARHFAAVIGGESLPERKPHPAPLRAAIAAAGGGAALYVGDSEVDAATAEAAGVPLILFTEGYRKLPVEQLRHAASFGDFADLPPIVRSLARAAQTFPCG